MTADWTTEALAVSLTQRCDALAVSIRDQERQQTERTADGIAALAAQIAAERRATLEALHALRALLDERERGAQRSRAEAHRTQDQTWAALDTRLQGLNGFRQLMSQERSDYVRREEFDQTVDRVNERGEERGKQNSDKIEHLHDLVNAAISTSRDDRAAIRVDIAQITQRLNAEDQHRQLAQQRMHIIVSAAVSLAAIAVTIALFVAVHVGA